MEKRLIKDVLLISNYWHFECEKSSSRYLTLANMITEAGMELEIITSTFYHATKSQREYNDEFLNSFQYKMTLIYESGYSSNVSLKRILSHKEFGNNVMKYIKQRKKPDVIYCFVPPLDLAYKVTKYANKNGIRLILDILDLWPEAYKMLFDVPIISNLLFAPMKYKANKIYAGADEIVAVSQTYVDRALDVNRKCKEGHNVFLGTELSTFDQLAVENKLTDKPTNEIWVAYIGTLGYSYDLTCVIDALNILKDKGHTNIKFIVMGDGPLRSKFEAYAKDLGVYIEFTGKLNYAKMVGKLMACDIAVNPITKGAAASIINKHADYVAAGLPIINTQECPEFKNLIADYNAGLNCKNNNPVDLSEKLSMLSASDKVIRIGNLSESDTLRLEMGRNSRRLAEDKFDRFRTYTRIVELIKNNMK